MAVIRTLRQDENFDALVELSRQFFEEYEAHHAEFFDIDQLNADDVVSYFLRFAEAENAAAFVACVDDQIVGYITVYVRSQADYWKFKQVGDISGLMVHKDYRRTGIGSQLMKAAAAFFREKEVKYYTLFTSVANQSALDFYAQVGLVPLYVTLINDPGNGRGEE